MNEEDFNHMPQQNRNKKFRPKKRKNKLVLVFDEDARREFLTGFHKRKLQRKKQAKEEFEKQLKLERKRIKAEAKEEYKKLLLKQKPIPELEDLLSEEIDMGTHSVSVTELSNADLAKKNNWIGVNEVQYEEKNDENLNSTSNKTKSRMELEGMEMQRGRPGKNKKQLDDKDQLPKTSKDIKKKIKKQATLNVKNSKIFQKKAKLEKMKNMKQQRKLKRRQEKLQKKNKRTKHKNFSEE